MLRMQRLPLCIAIASLVTVPIEGQCTNQVGQQNFLCDVEDDIYQALPCGTTFNDHPQCTRLYTPHHGCTFLLGNWDTEAFNLVWWKRKPGDPKPAPSEDECEQLEERVPTCGPAEEPQSPGCPDVEVSEDDCLFGCEGRAPADVLELWDEPCRAYALMPDGWKRDPWLPAVGFFTVGRPFPSEALGWMVGDEHYGAEHALAEGRLGPTVLGGVGKTPLWGGKDGIIDRSWRKPLRKVGVCVNEPGALLANPYWPGYNKKRFPALVNCDGAPFALKGLELWTNSAGWDEEKWRASGAMAADVLPRLELLESYGLELVCVTPELAQERRRLRAKKD